MKTRPKETETSEALRLHESRDAFRAQHHEVAAGSDETATAACWCISKGMAGMNSQTSGLARAVGFNFEFKDTVMKFPWNCLPVGWVPRSKDVLRDSRVLNGEPPRLVISCGRHGIIPALYLKKKLGKAVFTVHIQDPKIDTSGFDLVVIPKHDDARGPNVYLTMGALHYVTPEKLSEAARSPEAAALKSGRKTTVAVLLGGKNGYSSFSQADVDHLVAKLKRTTAGDNVHLAILKSRRTPDEVANRFKAEFGDEHFVWNGEGENPYFAALATADYVVVTGDSVSMVTEATANGRPVFVHHLTETRPARRFRRFHEMFEEAGITRPFHGDLADWRYTPPNDTPTVAKLIRERMGIE
ncbi:MAG: mitochondrial fission ELM1 family protein [Planctomycetes bacterium]|nr:mitochondrial fission ELM1 family protein [Planctomycetota bacterium]